MKLLLDNTFAPSTHTLCFVEATPESAAAAFISLMGPHYATHEPQKNISLTQQLLSGDLKQVLAHLEPLTGRDRKRFLFIPTQSHWTVYFDNGISGIEIHDFRIAALSLLKTPLLKVMVRPASHVYRGDALIWEVYAPEQQLFLDLRRSVSLTHDDLEWEFHAYGDPFDFEDTQRYTEKRKKDRFTFQMLDEYLRQFGVSAFDADFYMPQGSKAVLVEKHGNLDIKSELTIQEAQKLSLS